MQRKNFVIEQNSQKGGKRVDLKEGSMVYF